MPSDIKLATSPSAVRLALRGITKSYPSVVANDGIDLTVEAGRIHAVLGENGAGKSTLMKIIFGVVQPDVGTIHWEGAPVEISTPGQAKRLGIGMVFQHFSLFETLTAVENVALGIPGRSDLAALSSQIVALSDRYVLPVDPGRAVHSMSASRDHSCAPAKSAAFDHGRADLRACSASSAKAVRHAATARG